MMTLTRQVKRWGSSKKLDVQTQSPWLPRMKVGKYQLPNPKNVTEGAVAEPSPGVIGSIIGALASVTQS